MHSIPSVTRRTIRQADREAMKRKQTKNRVESVGTHLIMIVMVFISIFPLLIIILTSFKEPADIFTTSVQLFPPHPTWDNYKMVLTGNGGLFLT